MQGQHPQDTGDNPVAGPPVALPPPKFELPPHLINGAAVSGLGSSAISGPAPHESEAPKIPSDGEVPAGDAQAGLVNVVAKDRISAAPVLFAEVEPYPEPVNPAELFDEMAAVLLRYVVMEKEQADAAALWCAHTYLFEQFEVSPLAIIDAPERECAKTLFQMLLARMCCRPLPAANASPSALFRSVSTWAPTIFFDEADTFFKDKPELHGIVNAGYKRGGFVLRSEAAGNSFEPKVFHVYCPKSLAGIALEKHLQDSTMSRGVIFKMRRKLRHEKVERLRHADPNVFATIAAKLVRFAKDFRDQVSSARPVLPDELSDRDQDNWEPLLAIASCASPAWVERATAAALMLSGEKAPNTGNELLADIRTIFGRLGKDRIRSADLIDALCADVEAAWATYNNGRPLTPRQLSKLLAEYGIKPKTVRHGNATPKGYEVAQFADSFARYLQAPDNLPQRRNGSPDALGGMALGVSDGLQGDDDGFVSLGRCGVADKSGYGRSERSDDDF